MREDVAVLSVHDEVCGAADFVRDNHRQAEIHRLVDDEPPRLGARCEYGNVGRRVRVRDLSLAKKACKVDIRNGALSDVITQLGFALTGADDKQRASMGGAYAEKASSTRSGCFSGAMRATLRDHRAAFGREQNAARSSDRRGRSREASARKRSLSTQKGTWNNLALDMP